MRSSKKNCILFTSLNRPIAAIIAYDYTPKNESSNVLRSHLLNNPIKHLKEILSKIVFSSIKIYYYNFNDIVDLFPMDLNARQENAILFLDHSGTPLFAFVVNRRVVQSLSFEESNALLETINNTLFKSFVQAAKSCSKLLIAETVFDYFEDISNLALKNYGA